MLLSLAQSAVFTNTKVILKPNPAERKIHNASQLVRAFATLLARQVFQIAKVLLLQAQLLELCILLMHISLVTDVNDQVT